MQFVSIRYYVKSFCHRAFHIVILVLLLQYIRHCLAKGEIPQLCLFSRREVYASLPENTLHIPSYMRRTLPNPPTGNSLSLWQLNNLFRVHILWATYVNVRDVDMIYVRAGLYHGQEPLCSTKESQQVPFNSPKWHQWLTFELNLVDLPRGARLCLSICSVTKRKKREVSFFFYRQDESTRHYLFLGFSITGTLHACMG